MIRQAVGSQVRVGDQAGIGHNDVPHSLHFFISVSNLFPDPPSTRALHPQETSLGSDIGKLRQAGIATKLDHAKTHMHHKFCIIDRRLLLTGSFNWTRQVRPRAVELLRLFIISIPDLLPDFMFF